MPKRITLRVSVGSAEILAKIINAVTMGRAEMDTPSREAWTEIQGDKRTSGALEEIQNAIDQDVWEKATDS